MKIAFRECRLLRWGAMLAVAIGVGLGGLTFFKSAGVAATQLTSGPEARLRELKLELPAEVKPTNTLVNAVRVGDMLYVSGTGPGTVDGKPMVGRVGQDMDLAQGKNAARLVGLHVLSVVKAELGSLDKVERLVKTFGMVNTTAEFKDHPKVINGFSDLMVEVFGEKAGKGARSAVGMVSLPSGIPVEIEAIFQIRK